jgi:hypothetical protein
MDCGLLGFIEACHAAIVPKTTDDQQRCKLGNQANIAVLQFPSSKEKQLAAQVPEGKISTTVQGQLGITSRKRRW